VDRSNLKVAPLGRLIPNALSVEYEREYWCSSGYGEIANRVNNPILEGVVRIFGPGFCEELPSLVRCDCRSLYKDRRNPLLIGEQRGQHLS